MLIFLALMVPSNFPRMLKFSAKTAPLIEPSSRKIIELPLRVPVILPSISITPALKISPWIFRSRDMIVGVDLKFVKASS